LNANKLLDSYLKLRSVCVLSDGELIDQPSKCDEPAIMYYVNDGVYGSFNCLLFDHAEVSVSTLKVTQLNPNIPHLLQILR